jgi:PEP-CTERM/exosortase A-associated glycosyltransferase
MLATARRIDRLVQQTRPDVLHAHSPVLTVLPALWVARQRKVPVVYEIRALWEDGAVDHGTARHGDLRYRLTRALENYAIKHVDRITTICEGLRSELERRGVSRASITVIPNGVDVDNFGFSPTADAALRRQLGIEGSTVLGFIGSFYGYEGLELLIDAFAEVVQRRPEARLLFVGGGPREASMRERVERLHLQNRVTFAGRVPHDRIQSYYKAIDLLVYPRLSVRVTELVTPLKPLEAMAQGRLLVASDVGGHRELIKDGETGHLFPAGSVHGLAAKMDEVLGCREGWTRMRVQARRFVEAERTWKSSVARYAEVYQCARCAPAPAV